MTRLYWSKRVGRRKVVVEPPPLPRGTQHEVEYSAHQALLGRPVSPHLTVYKQSIPAVASITSRVCGIALSLGFGAAAAAASAGHDIPSLIHRAQDVVPGFVYVSKFAVAFPLTYHWLAGARHFVRCLVEKQRKAAAVAWVLRVMCVCHSKR